MKVQILFKGAVQQSTVVHPNMAGAHVVAGYKLERELPDLEWKLLRTLVASR